MLNKFARVGLSYISEHIGEPLRPSIGNADRIALYISAQPNGSPHFGTLIMLMSAFSVSIELRNFFKIPVNVVFDQLENAADRHYYGLRKFICDGQEIFYQKSLQDSILHDGRTALEVFMPAYRDILDKLSEWSQVPYEIRSYHEVQSTKPFREALCHIADNASSFSDILAPSTKKLGIRIPCPTCGLVEKDELFTKFSKYNHGYSISAHCPEHGVYSAVLTPDSTSFIDTNTSIRDVARGALLIEDGQRLNTLSLMLDGRDWSGRWNNHVFYRGLAALGFNYDVFPCRIFSPTVVDEYGAKLSKSLYVGNETYKSLPAGFKDYDDLIAIFGRNGFRVLWDHIKEWGKDPAYIDRESYSIRYFHDLLTGKLPLVQIL